MSTVLQRILPWPVAVSTSGRLGRAAAAMPLVCRQSKQRLRRCEAIGGGCGLRDAREKVAAYVKCFNNLQTNSTLLYFGNKNNFDNSLRTQSASHILGECSLAQSVPPLHPIRLRLAVVQLVCSPHPKGLYAELLRHGHLQPQRLRVVVPAIAHRTAISLQVRAHMLRGRSSR